ncbi:enoyl-CoA hydratase [Seongchinamella unica]|uniref:Enoyl-CoA hydratase n=1 Tax=Seongchinamella unica TaxID=2547392 RepID=A0A4R5LPN6_9GAMM|nr:enoyl-CoA hydratase [Seongchinamella unica]TDG12405.1 enoyl-CoA hydratase [Seongchinamella unica]
MSYVLVEYPREGICLITLNRPERMNAMAFDVMVPLKEALEEVGYNNDIRAVIVTGAGEGFCAGADLEDPGWLDIFNGLTVPGIARRAMRVLEDVVRTINNLPQPVIAAVNGAAIGGGFCLAMAADIRIASEKAYFRPAGINNGLTSAELGLSYLLPRAIGTSRAFEIMLTGRDVDALEAADMGIVSRCVHPDQLLEECCAMGERIAGFSQLGVEMSKQMLWAGVDAGSLHTHMNHEGHAQLYVRMTTRNFEEAIRARKEGRRPEYKD